MLTTLAWKEVRETAGIVAISMVVWSYFLFAMAIPTLAANEFLETGAIQGFWALSGCMAAGFALRQTVGESARGTFQFPLNRPARREQLLGTKLLVGVGLYLIVAALPVLLYAWRLATPGLYPYPFAWWMTAMAWKAWAAGTLVYLGAFLSGLRPGRWTGTRLLPLAATGGVTLFIPLLPWWWATGLPVVVILDVLLIGSIFYVARTRDFS